MHHACTTSSAFPDDIRFTDRRRVRRVFQLRNRINSPTRGRSRKRLPLTCRACECAPAVRCAVSTDHARRCPPGAAHRRYHDDADRHSQSTSDNVLFTARTDQRRAPAGPSPRHLTAGAAQTSDGPYRSAAHLKISGQTRTRPTPASSPDRRTACPHPAGSRAVPVEVPLRYGAGVERGRVAQPQPASRQDKQSRGSQCAASHHWYPFRFQAG